MTLTRPINLSPEPMKRRTYNKAYEALSERLLAAQHAIITHGLRVVVVFEGKDAAGKGGSIRRITSQLDPRAFKVWPIGAPREQYRGTHYLKRFWERLATPGTMAIFDRSWYGRVLVERVEGFADEAAWQRAYQEIIDFERLLITDGVLVIKLYLTISDAEQEARFKARLLDPAKRWKITAEDFRNRAKQPQYNEAVADMLNKTSHAGAPWTVVDSDNKKGARIAVIDALLSQIEATGLVHPGSLDPEISALAVKHFGLELE